MANLMEIKSKIFVPDVVDEESRQLIAREGAEVCVVSGSYDKAIEEAKNAANVEGGILVQDMGFPGYEKIQHVYATFN
jgi:threonine dehydratase